MSETRNRRREKKRNIAGDAAVAVILAMVCLVLSAGIAEVYIRDMLASDISVSVSRNFEANAESYSGNYSLDSLENIEAGSGAYIAEESEESAVSTIASRFPEEDFIFPHSADEILTDEDLAKLTDAASCQRAIDEILARHGCEFYEGNGDDYEFFNSKAWYKKLPKRLSSECLMEFSATENTNVALISNYQVLMGWYGGYY